MQHDHAASASLPRRNHTRAQAATAASRSRARASRRPSCARKCARRCADSRLSSPPRETRRPDRAARCVRRSRRRAHHSRAIPMRTRTAITTATASDHNNNRRARSARRSRRSSNSRALRAWSSRAAVCSTRIARSSERSRRAGPHPTRGHRMAIRRRAVVTRPPSPRAVEDAARPSTWRISPRRAAHRSVRDAVQLHGAPRTLLHPRALPRDRCPSARWTPARYNEHGACGRCAARLPCCIRGAPRASHSDNRE